MTKEMEKITTTIFGGVDFMLNAMFVGENAVDLADMLTEKMEISVGYRVDRKTGVLVGLAWHDDYFARNILAKVENAVVVAVKTYGAED